MVTGMRVRQDKSSRSYSIRQTKPGSRREGRGANSGQETSEERRRERYAKLTMLPRHVGGTASIGDSTRDQHSPTAHI